MRRLTDEELARAVRIDPSQIRGLGPSLEYLRAMLEERKRKILETYETGQVAGRGPQQLPRAGRTDQAAGQARAGTSRRPCAKNSCTTWNSSGIAPATNTARSPGSSCKLIERLGEKYQVDELAAKYEFTGRTPMDVPKALEIKEELETIDKLLKQIEEAAKTAQIGIIDLEELAQFAEPGDIEQLAELQEQIQEYLKQMREQQGIEEGQARLPDDAESVPAVPVEAADANLRADAGVALRPAPGADRRRRRRGDAADEALRVRRLRDAHGHPGVVRQRAAAERPWPAGAPQDGRHRHPPDAQQSQVRHGRAAGHERLDALRRPCTSTSSAWAWRSTA